MNQLGTAARLIRPTAASWTHEMIMEAVRNGYEVAFSFEDGFVTASFWNQEYHCYSREWTP